MNGVLILAIYIRAQHTIVNKYVRSKVSFFFLLLYKMFGRLKSDDHTQMKITHAPETCFFVFFF